jgi:hypothetical protein
LTAYSWQDARKYQTQSPLRVLRRTGVLNSRHACQCAQIYPIPPSGEKAGTTDKYIASWLKEQKREEIILATKVAGANENIKYLR